jgi:hypothetical protein
MWLIIVEGLPALVRTPCGIGHPNCPAYPEKQAGFSPEQADARALLFYSFLFGQSLLLFKTPGPRRKALLQACAAVLIRRESD